MRELALEVSDMSTLTTEDIMAVIEVFLTLISEHLAQGEFGNFWLRFSAEGVSTPEKVRGDLITRLIPRFMPGKEFRLKLQTVEFAKRR